MVFSGAAGTGSTRLFFFLRRSQNGFAFRCQASLCMFLQRVDMAIPGEIEGTVWKLMDFYNRAERDKRCIFRFLGLATL